MNLRRQIGLLIKILFLCSHLFLRPPVRGVALPEPPGVAVNVAEHGVAVLEAGEPAQRAIAEHPQAVLTLVAHDDRCWGRREGGSATDWRWRNYNNGRIKKILLTANEFSYPLPLSVSRNAGLQNHCMMYVLPSKNNIRFSLWLMQSIAQDCEEGCCTSREY